MKFKYKTKHHSEPITFASVFDMSDIELGCLEDVGAEAGQHFHESGCGHALDAYDGCWEIDFTIYDLHGSVLGIVCVQKYVTPAFSSYTMEDFVGE